MFQRLMRESHSRQLTPNEIRYMNSAVRNQGFSRRRFWSSRMYQQVLPGRRGLSTIYPPSRFVRRRLRRSRR